MGQKMSVLILAATFLAGSAIVSHAAGTSSSAPSWGSTSGPSSPSPSRSSASEASVPSLENRNKPEEKTEEKLSVSLYNQGVTAGKNNDFQAALTFFEGALSEDNNNPDIINMLAHTQRKLGMIDEALANYKKALELRPRFPEAREYLGEAYVQAALREIETLKSYGSEANENLDDLTKDFKEAAETL